MAIDPDAIGRVVVSVDLPRLSIAAEMERDIVNTQKGAAEIDSWLARRLHEEASARSEPPPPRVPVVHPLQPVTRYECPRCGVVQERCGPCVSCLKTGVRPRRLVWTSPVLRMAPDRSRVHLDVTYLDDSELSRVLALMNSETP